MKPVSLLLLRVSLGALIIIWAMVKIAAPDAAIGVSDKYYGGLLSNGTMQFALGIVQLTLGVLVVGGAFRRIAYPLMIVWLGFGALAVWKSIIDPLGVIYGQDNVQILFFPSLIVFFATLVVYAFRDDDTLSIDAKRGA